MSFQVDPRKAFLTEKLPESFKFPSSYIDFLKSNRSEDIHPWWLMYENPGTSDAWLQILRESYPNRMLVPFAKFDYTDDIVCFEANTPSLDPVVHYVHTFTTPGWEDRGHVKNFSEWLHFAMLDAKDDRNSRAANSDLLK